MAEYLAGIMGSGLDSSNVLNTSITASWVILVVLLLRMIFRKTPKWIHVALWGLVAVRLLFPFSIESAFSLIPSTEPFPREILRYEGEQRMEPAHIDIVTNPVISEKITIDLNQTVGRVQVKDVYMTLIWWGGMLLMFLYTAVSYLVLSIRMRTAVLLHENIYQSEKAGAPFVLGIFRPRIYLPFDMSEQDMTHVIAHEKAHIRRKDHWWKPLGFLLLSIHWFNPLMWVMYVLLCRDIELACDEKVIKELGHDERADYSQALLSCSVKRRIITACPLAFGEVGVKERIKNVLSYKKPAFWVILVALTAGAITAVCFLTDPITGEDELVVLEVLTHEDGDRESIQTEFEAKLGDKVKSGRLYVEQWYNGACERSLPAAMTQDLTHLFLHVTADPHGGTVWISTNEFGGEWMTDFYIPEGETVTDWSFVSGEKEDALKAKAGDESILCSLDFDSGRQIIVRAVWSDEPIKEREPDATNRVGMKMFQLEEEIELDDRARKDAYILALERLIYQRIAPDGETWVYGTFEYAIFDIDRDGEKELIIRMDQGAMASMSVSVYDYDEETNSLRREYGGFISLHFYENGSVVEWISHNHGPASGSEDFWPYCVYQYNEVADCYEEVAYVEGWLKEPGPKTYDGREFPDDADLDGDGMVYFVMTDGYLLENPVDNEEYNTWRESTVGNAPEITFSYRLLPVVRPPIPG